MRKFQPPVGFLVSETAALVPERVPMTAGIHEKRGSPICGEVISRPASNGGSRASLRVDNAVFRSAARTKIPARTTLSRANRIKRMLYRQSNAATY